MTLPHKKAVIVLEKCHSRVQVFYIPSKLKIYQVIKLQKIRNYKSIKLNLKNQYITSTNKTKQTFVEKYRSTEHRASKPSSSKTFSKTVKNN